MDAAELPDQIFIYGTLIPGEPRWSYIEDYVVSTTPDTTRGKLFDTGAGYPAARFDCTATIPDRIHGLRVAVDRTMVSECLELLDEVESAVTGLYHRLIVDTDGGEQAWAYQYGRGFDHLTPIATGSWVQHTTGMAPDTASGESGGPESGDGILSFIEARVIGALIEKSLATPQNYPLSLNALVNACNQSSSRDPITNLAERDVMAMLTQGKERRLLRFVHPRSGHGVTKYRHVLDEFLDLDEASVALIGVLLLRGPQTSRELRDRTERLHPFPDTDAVEATLADLAERGLTLRLARQSGQRDERWAHLLCGPVSA